MRYIYTNHKYNNNLISCIQRLNVNIRQNKLKIFVSFFCVLLATFVQRSYTLCKRQRKNLHENVIFLTESWRKNRWKNLRKLTCTHRERERNQFVSRLQRKGLYMLRPFVVRSLTRAINVWVPATKLYTFDALFSLLFFAVRLLLEKMVVSCALEKKKVHKQAGYGIGQALSSIIINMSKKY